MKKLEILKLTFAVCGLIMCGTVAGTAINMANGQYRVEIGVNNQGLIIKSEIDKKECFAADFEQKVIH